MQTLYQLFSFYPALAGWQFIVAFSKGEFCVRSLHAMPDREIIRNSSFSRSSDIINPCILVSNSLRINSVCCDFDIHTKKQHHILIHTFVSLN